MAKLGVYIHIVILWWWNAIDSALRVGDFVVEMVGVSLHCACDILCITHTNTHHILPIANTEFTELQVMCA